MEEDKDKANAGINKTKRDAGIETGYSWLVSHILKNWSALSARVDEETEQQLNIERQVMNERYRRFRNRDGRQSGDRDAKEDAQEEGITSHSQPETTSKVTGVHPVLSEGGEQILSLQEEEEEKDPRSLQENRHPPSIPPGDAIVIDGSPSKSTDEDEGVDVRDTNHDRNDSARESIIEHLVENQEEDEGGKTDALTTILVDNQSVSNANLSAKKSCRKRLLLNNHYNYNKVSPTT